MKCSEDTTAQKQPQDSPGLPPLTPEQLTAIQKKIFKALRGVKKADSYKVYFIQEPGSGSIKIGMARKPRVRMRDLQVAHPLPLLMLGYCDGGLWLEQELHREFAADRLQGEWFKPTDALMARMRELCGELWTI